MAEKEERTSRGITSYRPFRELSEMQDQINRLWDTMWGPRFWRPFRVAKDEWMPAADVYQKEGAVHVKVELPGLSEKDIEITVTEDTLTLSGERSEEKEIKEKDFYRCERSYGRFMRQIALPAGTDADKAKASFKDGVLEIELPLKETPKQKKIEVSAGG